MLLKCCDAVRLLLPTCFIARLPGDKNLSFARVVRLKLAFKSLIRGDVELQSDISGSK